MKVSGSARLKANTPFCLGFHTFKLNFILAILHATSQWSERWVGAGYRHPIFLLLLSYSKFLRHFSAVSYMNHHTGLD